MGAWILIFLLVELLILNACTHICIYYDPIIYHKLAKFSIWKNLR